MSYTKLLNVPQSAPTGPEQVRNSAGGFTFTVSPWTRLDRWILLGADTNTYYVQARPLALENMQAVRLCLAEDGVRTVTRIAAISEAGRAPKNDAAIYALAIAAAEGAPEVKALALGLMPRVCRTGTHLLQFVEALNSLRGWGRQAR